MNESDLAMLRSRAETVCHQLLKQEGSAHCSGTQRVAEVLAAFAHGGLLEFLSLQRSFAGSAGEARRMASVIEVLSRHSGLLASIYMVNVVLGGALILLAGTQNQKNVLVPRLKRGALQLAFAMTEPDAGSDAAGIATTARRDGEDFLLRGEKIYSTGAASADWIIVVARLAEHATAKRAMSLFLVPNGAEGLVVEPLEKLASGDHASCRLILSDVRLGSDQVLGGLERLGSAWEVLRTTGSIERLMVAAMALGLATAVVDRAIDFAKTREQFGQRIAMFQSIQHTLVDMRITQTAMRLFVNEAVSALEAGGEATEAVCMAKCFCSEQLQELIGQGMRVMGGRGYFEFEQMTRYYREAPFTLYAGGTVEIQKMLIARRMGLDVANRIRAHK